MIIYCTWLGDVLFLGLDWNAKFDYFKAFFNSEISLILFTTSYFTTPCVKFVCRHNYVLNNRRETLLILKRVPSQRFKILSQMSVIVASERKVDLTANALFSWNLKQNHRFEFWSRPPTQTDPGNVHLFRSGY